MEMEKNWKYLIRFSLNYIPQLRVNNNEFRKVERSQHRACENTILTITKRFAHVSPPTEQTKHPSKGDEPANDFHACSRPWNKINGLCLRFFFFFFFNRVARVIPFCTSKTRGTSSHRLGSNRSNPRSGGRDVFDRAAKEGGEDRILRRRLASPDARVPPSLPVATLAEAHCHARRLARPRNMKTKSYSLSTSLTDRFPFISSI